MALAIVGLSIASIACADTSPNGPGQPGAPNTTCGSSNANTTPGVSNIAPGSPFNGSGVAGTVYAGNNGTASLIANNSHVVSQYDIACFQVSQSHP
jgi:hypothetical protein